MVKMKMKGLLLGCVLIGLFGCQSTQFDTPLDALQLNDSSHEKLLIYKEVVTPNGLIMMYEIDGLDCVSVAFISEQDEQWTTESSGGAMCEIDRTATNLATLKGGNIMPLSVVHGFLPPESAYIHLTWVDGVTTQTDIGRDGVLLFPRYDSVSPESFVLYDASHTVIEQGVFSDLLKYHSSLK